MPSSPTGRWLLKSRRTTWLRGRAGMSGRKRRGVGEPPLAVVHQYFIYPCIATFNRDCTWSFTVGRFCKVYSPYLLLEVVVGQLRTAQQSHRAAAANPGGRHLLRLPGREQLPLTGQVAPHTSSVAGRLTGNTGILRWGSTVTVSAQVDREWIMYCGITNLSCKCETDAKFWVQ